jgi:hypothetical protein
MLHRSISYRLIVGLGAVALAVLLFAVGAGAAPSLGTAAPYAVLAGTTVTNTGPTVVTGDLGVSPGSAVTGFPVPGTVIGTIHSNDASAIGAQTDVTTAYNNLAGQACTPASHNLTGIDLGGLTLTPGVYCFSSSAALSIPAAPTLTLDALGDPNAVWIFQIGSTLTTASSSTVKVINGGQVCNVFWQVGSSATLGTSTAFVGNILALTSITLTTNASVSGRALAQNGAVTMDTNNVTKPTACVTSTPIASPTATAAPPVTPSHTPAGLPSTGGLSSRGDHFPWTLLLAGLVASSLGASALVLGARARRRDAQQSGR